MGDLQDQAQDMLDAWSGARAASESAGDYRSDDAGPAPWARPWFSPEAAGGACTGCAGGGHVQHEGAEAWSNPVASYEPADGPDSELGPWLGGEEIEDDDDDDAPYYSLNGRDARGDTPSEKPAQISLIRRTEYTLVSIAPPPQEGPSPCTPFTLPFGGCNPAPAMPSATAAGSVAAATAPANAECGVYSSVGCPVACTEDVPAFPGPEAIDEAPVRWFWFPRDNRREAFVTTNKEIIARAWVLLIRNWDLVAWSLCSVGAEANMRAKVRGRLFGEAPGRVIVWFDSRRRGIAASHQPVVGRVRVGTMYDCSTASSNFWICDWLAIYAPEWAPPSLGPITPSTRARRRAVVVDVAAALLHELVHVANFDRSPNHDPQRCTPGCLYPLTTRRATYWGMEPCQTSYKVVGVVRNALLTRYSALVAPCALALQQRGAVCVNPTTGVNLLTLGLCP